MNATTDYIDLEQSPNFDSECNEVYADLTHYLTHYHLFERSIADGNSKKLIQLAKIELLMFNMIENAVSEVYQRNQIKKVVNEAYKRHYPNRSLVPDEYNYNVAEEQVLKIMTRNYESVKDYSEKPNSDPTLKMVVDYLGNYLGIDQMER